MDLLSTANNVLKRYLNARGTRSVTRAVGGCDVHAYELEGSGKGPPILLVHGLGGSANGFHKTFDRLAARFSRVVAVDFPGNGFSPLPASGPLNARAQLEVLDAFLCEAMKEKALLVGTSLGGAMAIQLASRRPERLAGLALVAPAGAQVTAAQLEALFASLNVKTTAQARALTRRLFHRAPMALLLVASQLRHMYGSPTVQAFLSEVSAADTLSPEVLGALTMPVLVVWGGSEKLLPAEGVEFFRTHLPAHARIEVVPGFGHVPQYERPAELARRLIAFADDAQL